jgi:outer membrane protein OmpA-like peptidoglycan-associated protein
MKLLNSLTIISLLAVTSFQAQVRSGNFEKEFDRAEKIFSEIYRTSKTEALNRSKGGYAEARTIFLDLYKQEPNNANLAFKIGVCYQASRRYVTDAIPYFKNAVSSVSKDYKESSYKEKNAPLVAYKFLADAYHLDSQFDKAIETYEKYITVLTENKVDDKVILAEANRKIEMCKMGKSLTGTPVNMKIENLGSTVNSTYADYAPVLSADQTNLFFTSRRSDTKGGQTDAEGNFMEDIYMSTKTKTGWSTAVGIGNPVNTNDCEATIGISPDGQTILIYKDDLGDGNIYSTTLDGDVWSTPVKLNDYVNTKSWEPSAFISADGTKLYFVSNRPEGYGGRDIYVSRMMPTGDWGKATNLGPNINTSFDEDAPFIHPDGVTLSFSSNGHNTMGGFDIFTSLLSENKTWSEPMNVGYPLNTPDDDVFYVVSPNGKTAYFSSFREGGLGEKDNYMATFPDRKETALTLIKGIVNDESGNPAKKVLITVTDNQTEEVVGIYHTNRKTGQFLFILTPDKNYNITYQAEGHLFYSENLDIPKESNYYEINMAVTLNPIVVGSKIVLNNIFFDFDKSTLRTLSNVELKNLVTLMKSNTNLKVEISGHTDSKGDLKYNQKLSEERAKAVVNRLAESGIEITRMKAKGYGKTSPAANNKKNNGKDDPAGRQLNRRVELEITEIK